MLAALDQRGRDVGLPIEMLLRSQGTSLPKRNLPGFVKSHYESEGVVETRGSLRAV